MRERVEPMPGENQLDAVLDSSKRFAGIEHARIMRQGERIEQGQLVRVDTINSGEEVLDDPHQALDVRLDA